MKSFHRSQKYFEVKVTAIFCDLLNK